jgi:RNA recognition motif-containing protein
LRDVREHQWQNDLVTNIFIGNLDITVTEQQLRGIYAVHGAVETVTIVVDRDTGEPRGIARTQFSIVA